MTHAPSDDVCRKDRPLVFSFSIPSSQLVLYASTSSSISLISSKCSLSTCDMRGHLHCSIGYWSRYPEAHSVKIGLILIRILFSSITFPVLDPPPPTFPFLSFPFLSFPFLSFISFHFISFHFFSFLSFPFSFKATKNTTLPRPLSIILIHKHRCITLHISPLLYPT